MPAELAEARVSLPEFAAFQAMWRQLRPLALALDFTANTRGGVRREDLQRIALRVLRTRLPPLEVEVLFYLFGARGGGPDACLNTHYMYQVGVLEGWLAGGGGGGCRGVATTDLPESYSTSCDPGQSPVLVPSLAYFITTSVEASCCGCAVCCATQVMNRHHATGLKSFWNAAASEEVETGGLLGGEGLIGGLLARLANTNRD